MITRQGWCFIGDLLKALPYLGGIGTFLIAIWKWVFDALKEERDHYQEKCQEQEKEIDKLKEKNLKLQRKVDQQQILINEYIKKAPTKGAFFDGGKNDD